MTPDPAAAPAPGWIGGFAQSNPAFAYPNPDLSSLPLLGNMANIDLLQRQQSVQWPEFSWLTVPGDPSSRAFQMFAPDISRIGYTDRGRVYSIICPQQGACSPSLGCLDVEVSVLGQRGWVDEDNRTLAADMEVEAKIWFNRSAHANSFVRMMWALFADNGLPFPADKANAIIVRTNKEGNPLQPVFPVRKGETTLFESPAFAKHPEAWTVGNVEVQIGRPVKTGDGVVDDFNQLVLDAFNLATGDLLRPGNLLSWNVWFTAPELVDQQEWRDHAERWRRSIDSGHGSPDGPGTPARYFDGSPFQPAEAALQEEVDKIIAYLKKHLAHL
jgi:hypothetical protein